MRALGSWCVPTVFLRCHRGTKQFTCIHDAAVPRPFQIAFDDDGCIAARELEANNPAGTVAPTPLGDVQRPIRKVEDTFPPQGNVVRWQQHRCVAN